MPKKSFSFLKTCALVLCLLALAFCALPHPKTLSVQADSGYVMSIDRYDVDIVVHQDRSVSFDERIVMTPNRAGRIFTRSLPLEGDAYSNLSVSCESVFQGETFSYDVVTDEYGEFLHIECDLPSKAGETRVYRFQYDMRIGADDVENGMILDVIGYGWGVPLNDVTVNLQFPSRLKSNNFTIYSGRYGSNGNNAGVAYSLSQDGKTLRLEADRLDVVYNSEYGERMAEGISLQFALEEGALDGYGKAMLFTENTGVICIFGVLACGLAVVALLLTKKKREIVPIVNVSAPDGCDPMRMGKILDGNVDKEDITSMIYYFAHKGYLFINLEDKEHPKLIRKVVELPLDVPIYQRTLFKGLFKSGEVVSVDDLSCKFYEYADKAVKQVPAEKMYENRSVFGLVAGGVLGVLYALCLLLYIGIAELGGYIYFFGAVFALPAFAVVVISFIKENYRYKWKAKTRLGATVLEIVICALAVLLFTVFFAKHLTTVYQRVLIGIFAVLPPLITSSALSRTEKYCEKLGDILGFKEFIVVTEEDKIKFMLEQDPTLYFKVLPYAQVLGVTDEWTDKFKNILIPEPAWCVGCAPDLFDYLILRHSIRVLTRGMMVRPQPKQGSFTGRSGGGGHFGGFGGGGHGGGGGGWR